MSETTNSTHKESQMNSEREQLRNRLRLAALGDPKNGRPAEYLVRLLMDAYDALAHAPSTGAATGDPTP